jgi:hypothetical protein
MLFSILAFGAFRTCNRLITKSNFLAVFPTPTAMTPAHLLGRWSLTAFEPKVDLTGELGNTSLPSFHNPENLQSLECHTILNIFKQVWKTWQT